MKRNLALACLIVLFVTSDAAAQRIVPIDNKIVRVVVATSTPGPKGRMHRHDVNRVMVYLDKGAQRLDYQDGAARDIRFEAGEVQWDPMGGMHTSQNVGGTTFRVVEIELKQAGGEPRASQELRESQLVTPELDNDQVRVTRVSLGARETVRGYGAAARRIIVPLTRVDLAAGARSVAVEPGTAVFDSGSLNGWESRRNERTEFVVVELRD